MGFLGLDFNNKYKDMLKDLSSYINSDDFKNMSKEKKEELYADYCLLKKLISEKHDELKKIYFGTADSISRLWPLFIKSKREVNEININTSRKISIEQYFLSDFITQRQIKAQSLKRTTERMQSDFDDLLSHPAILQNKIKYSYSPTTNVSEDEHFFDKILDEQVNRVKTTIDILKLNLEKKKPNLNREESILLQEIQQNGNIENIKINLIVLMSKYKENISSDCMSCKIFFDGIDKNLLTAYVLREYLRKGLEKQFFEPNKHAPKL